MLRFFALVLLHTVATSLSMGTRFGARVPSLLMSAAGGSVTPGVIIGGGRIGNFLYESNGKKDILLDSRDAAIPADSSGPCYVCTRNNDLDAIIEKTPEHRRGDLVFLQNGMLVDYLDKKGLGDNTQALIYFAVAKKGEAPTDGKTSVNPEGLTAVMGKWGPDLAARLSEAALSCHVLERGPWTVAMMEKHIWICAFMAVGASHGGCTVGQVNTEHNAQVRALIDELAVAAKYGMPTIDFSPGLGDRLCAYADSVAHFPTALKEFEWRNGYFTDLSLRAAQEMKVDPCPTHTGIMSDQGLLYQARKSFVAKKKAFAAEAMPKWQTMKDAADYQDMLRLEQRQKAELAGENVGKPKLKTSSPTILLKNTQD